jgi:phosphatidate cytidylyltransferase
MLAMGVLILSSVFLAMIQLHQTPAIGSGLVMFLFVLIWVADSGAYFAGRAFGKHKLSPHVSPGKTWEGAFGALLGAVVCGVVLHRFEWFELSVMQLVFVCVATAWVSIGGDLFESVMKRQADVKDSGNLFPGHGGVLDRIDSLLAAAPVFLMLVALAGGLK